MSSLVSIDWQPQSRQLRNFGWICLGFCLLLAGMVLLKGRLLFWEVSPERTNQLAYGLGAFGAFCALLAQTRPQALRPLYLGLSAITFPIGLVVSQIIALVLYYLILTPVALVFKIIGRDPMLRTLDPEAKSYWHARPPQPPAERYFRQF